MNEFPDFMRRRANLIRTADQHTPGIEGYIYDGADGSQMAIWTHVGPSVGEPGFDTHTFDEWLVVVQGEYTLEMDGSARLLRPGDEATIPAGTPHMGRCGEGVTRTIHAVGGHRADRASGDGASASGRVGEAVE